jgi:DNA-binding MarR family transcriptional regulator
VRVTPEGRRLLERSRRRKEAYLAKALRSLEPEELLTLEAAAEILERLTDAPSESRAGARS